MRSSIARRLGASLYSVPSSPPCRTVDKRLFQRVMRNPNSRSITSTTRRWQQAVPAAIQSQTTSAPQTPPPGRATSNAQQVASGLSPSSDSNPLRSLTDGLDDPPSVLSEEDKQVDWTRSFQGLSSTPFTAEQAAILQQKIEPDDIEIKPDGIIYLPEIKYRRILNAAFGPGGWGLAPRGETIVTTKIVTREYGLVAGGR